MSEHMYLGRAIDDAGELTGTRAGPPAERLRRHGVVIGMTGSGKTGLCVALVEELVRQGVPVLAIDPKGDLGNLGLVFPELRGEDFAPWTDPGEAQKKGTTQAGLGEEKAALWRSGLAKWDLGPADLRALKDRMDLRVFTPGSETGRPVDVLAALRRPGEDAMADADTRRALVTGTTSALLGLIGLQKDPVRDPEHLVLARILEEAWTAGEDLDAETLLLRIVDPPFKKVGVFPTDRFWPPDDRMDVAMRLNGVLASPAFAAWTRGTTLDPAVLLEPGADGRVPVNVFSLAHLADAERMFFVSLLLERVVAWSRSLPGTGSLRALVYLDEAFGYMPPHPKEPPSKRPLLTLMKQARAVGVGVLLATQNPVDLDYKGLTNAGTWLLGRLSTERDVERVSEGLEAAGGGGRGLADRLARLKPREFLLRDVSEDEPVVLRSRWAMSFLRGPVTRAELRMLSDLLGRPDAPAAREAAPAPAAALPEDGTTAAPPEPPGVAGAFFLDPRAAFSARLGGVFEPYREPARADGALHCRPALYARLALRFDEERHGYILDEEHHLLWFPLDGGRLPDEPLRLDLQAGDLLHAPPPGARFDGLPEFLDEKDELRAAQKRLEEDVYAREARGQWVCAPLKLHGRAGESREDFEARCREQVEDRVDEAVAALKGKVERKIERVEEQLRKKEGKLDQLEGKLKGQRTEQAVHAGEVVLSFFFGRKRSVSSVLTKQRSASATRGRVDEAEADVVALQQELEALREELEEAVREIEEEELEALDAIEEQEVRLEKTDIRVLDFGILWVPVSSRI